MEKEEGQDMPEIFHPLPDSLMDCPIDYIGREHTRHMALCGYFRDKELFARMCRGEAQDAVRCLHSFLTQQLPVHVRDEQQALFPLLIRYAGDADRKVRDGVKFVRREQEFDKSLIAFVLADLETLRKGHVLVNPLRLELNLETLLEGIDRHARWERDNLIPEAEKALPSAAKQEIRERMASWRE